VADHVLLHEVREETLVDVVHDRRGQRQEVAGEPSHLLGHLQRGDAVAHERLVDVEVEEAHLRIGHLRQRLPVDARDLQERDEREACIEDGGDVAQELQVLLGDVLERGGVEAHGRVDALDERGLEPALEGRLLDRVVGRGGRQQLLDVAEGEPALLRRAPDLGQRVAALAQAGDHAGLRDRPLAPAAVRERRDEAVLHPAAQRVSRDAGAPRSLGRRDPVAHAQRSRITRSGPGRITRSGPRTSAAGSRCR
jgi:hypothetical protein